MQDTRVRSLDREDPLEKELATHCSILACEIPWTEEPGGLQSMGFERVRYEDAMRRGQSATKRGSSLESDQVGTLICLTCSSSAVGNIFLLFILLELYEVHGTL